MRTRKAMSKYRVSLFTHCAETKCFTAEASELEGGPSPTITLVSDGGNEATFARIGVERSNDEDDEIIAWTYRPAAESLDRNPRLAGYSLTLFND
jgi:hypothetical protein